MKITSKAGSTMKNKTGSWRTYKPKTDSNKCIGCGMCVKVCPENCVVMKKNKNGQLKPKIDYNYCKGCGLCAEECPVKAINMEMDRK